MSSATDVSGPAAASCPVSISAVTRPITPWPHIVLYPSLCMNSTPYCASEVTGGVTIHPYIS